MILYNFLICLFLIFNNSNLTLNLSCPLLHIIGYTENLESPFAYGTSDPGKIMLSFLPAFFSYAGWLV